jgi:hypothetical protein
VVPAHEDGAKEERKARLKEHERRIRKKMAELEQKLCDICGTKTSVCDLQLDADGLRVCPECFDESEAELTEEEEINE